MSIDEARRLLLHDAARTAWGAEAALVVMEMLPPTGWADVATRRDLDQLEARLEARSDHRFDQLEAELDHQIGALRLELAATIAVGQRRSTQWNVGTIIAVVGIMTAILRLG
jgi:hypothetical protein